MNQLETANGKVTGGECSMPPPRGTCRIALVCTPRTGNTWLRHLLCDAFDLQGHAIVRPEDFEWDHAPERCLIAIHWPRTAEFVELLRRTGFRVVVLTRHPLDVLVSIFRFARHSPSCNRWLDGQGGDESALRLCSLGSPEFLEYAVSERARRLLGVSLEWWTDADAIRVRYEDLVADPQRRLEEIAQTLGQRPANPPAEVVARFDAESMRTVVSQHVWQAKPGLWRRVLSPESAFAIAEAHSLCFIRFGYVCDPGTASSRLNAAENWTQMEVDLLWSQIKQTHDASVENYRKNDKLGEMIEEINAKRAARAELVDSRLEELNSRLNATYLELAELRRHVGELDVGRRLYELERQAIQCNADARLAELESKTTAVGTMLEGFDRRALDHRLEAAHGAIEAVRNDPRFIDLQHRCETLAAEIAAQRQLHESSELPGHVAALAETMTRVLRHLGELDHQLAQLGGVGPNGLAIAHGLHRFSNRHPTVASIVKRIAGGRNAA